MTGFSQPERRGLERLQVPNRDSHPDPDLLAAFAEHSLTPREKEQVLGHLVSCELCRDTVALAGSPLVEPIPEPVQKRAWWEMPLFRWGALAATAVVLVGAISLGTYHRASSPTAALFNESPQALNKQVVDKVAAEPSANAEVSLSLKMVGACCKRSQP